MAHGQQENGKFREGMMGKQEATGEPDGKLKGEGERPLFAPALDAWTVQKHRARAHKGEGEKRGNREQKKKGRGGGMAKEETEMRVAFVPSIKPIHISCRSHKLHMSCTKGGSSFLTSTSA
jgi:hypothetical protein